MANAAFRALEPELSRVARSVEETLSDLLPTAQDAEARLHEAMRYAMLGGGNRLRGFLAVQSGHLFGVDERSMLRIGAAIECLHTQALIHDDLPSVGDAPRRRGKAATHVAFDQATAVLAGDALASLGFSILSSPRTCPDPFIRCTLINHLCEAVGHGGVLGGQMIDHISQGQDVDIGTLTRLQRMKTGALIAFSCETGPLVARGSDDLHHALNGYAHDLALAFQIMDDLSRLQHSSTSSDLSAHDTPDAETQELGEGPGQASFVHVLGEERAKDQAVLLASQAIGHLDVFDDKADPLRQVADFVVNGSS